MHATAVRLLLSSAYLFLKVGQFDWISFPTLFAGAQPVWSVFQVHRRRLMWPDKGGV